jgi:hypothetical protein
MFWIKNQNPFVIFWKELVRRCLLSNEVSCQLLEEKKQQDGIMADTSHSPLHHTAATMIHAPPFIYAKRSGSASSLDSMVSSLTRCRRPGMLLVLVMCGVLFQVTAFAPASSRRTPLKSVAEDCKTPFLFGRSTKRRMVSDIADSVIEKATTRMVLDQILDESLRTSARKPIMYQFDPSSRAVCYHVPFPNVLTLLSNDSIKLMLLSFSSCFALSSSN